MRSASDSGQSTETLHGKNSGLDALGKKDYFIREDGVCFAGRHLIIDLWEATNLTDPGHVERVLRRAAEAAGATILHGHFHHFGPNAGVSGVLVLAESHVSIHTWPERSFAALDIFVCGACFPHRAVPVFQEGFASGRISVSELRRGIQPD